MGLSVRSSRCSAISMIIFGFFFLVGGAAYISFIIIVGNYAVISRMHSNSPNSTTKKILTLSWYAGYPSLLALITMVTGCIGVCASARRTHHDTCLTVTLFIFSSMVAVLSGYTIFDFSLIVAVTDRIAKIETQSYNACNSLCTVLYVTIEGSLLGLAILVLLLSSWAIICCIASCCCHTEVEPEPMPTQQRQTVGCQQATMMQGPVMVPMMRRDTVPVMVPPNPAMVQAVPVMPISHPVHLGTVNHVAHHPLQAMPMQVAAIPDGTDTSWNQNILQANS